MTDMGHIGLKSVLVGSGKTYFPLREERSQEANGKNGGDRREEELIEREEHGEEKRR